MKRQAALVIVAYVLLTVVMGGRTMLFVRNFGEFELTFFGLTLRPLSFLLAFALIIAVAGSAWWRAHYGKTHRGYKIATQTMIGATALDGIFNVSEAILLAQDTGILANQPRVIEIWMWLSVILIGAGPTFLTVGLASLAGTVDRTTRPNKRTSTKVAVAIERTVETNPVLEAHCSRIERQLTPGSTFTREMVEQWTGLGKGQALNVINYGRDQGLIEVQSRGTYILLDNEN